MPTAPHAAIASGAAAVAVPEVPFDEAACMEKIRRLREDGKRSFLVIVSEGVETKEQLEFLQSVNCDMIQGYLFDKPLSTYDFEQRLKNKDYPIHK